MGQRCARQSDNYDAEDPR